MFLLLFPTQPTVKLIYNCLQDGLINPTDAALRDLSGSSLQEFVLWSIKQSTKEVCFYIRCITILYQIKLKSFVSFHHLVVFQAFL